MRLLKSVAGVRVVMIALMLAGGAAAQWACASGTRAAHPARPAVHLTMDQAVRMVEKRFKATVVRAETRKKDGHILYVMRLLDQHGRVFTVRVEASSGTIF